MQWGLLTFLLILAQGSFASQHYQIYHQNFTPSPGIHWLQSTGIKQAQKEFGSGDHKVIIAVIDSGVDINHKDLQGKVWINQQEIPNNGIDDDYNGYIDDIAGWNFIGSADGQARFNIEDTQVEIFDQQDSKQIQYDTFASTRKLKRLRAKGETDPELERLIEKKLDRAEKLIKEYTHEKEMLEKACFILNQNCSSLDLQVLKELETENEIQEYAQAFLISMLENGLSYGFILEELETFQIQKDYHFNIYLNDRFQIVRDDPNVLIEKGYGNNDIKGPNSNHGTHVAGIISTISNTVEIMPLRAIPNGDERDKDIINAIHYAIDNGAHIINMSFGKYVSEYKEEVWRAMEAARRAGILIVLAAGNDQENIDQKPSYPNPNSKSGRLENVLTIGAADEGGLITNFSNRGQQSVSFLAPGKNIYSTFPNNQYKSLSGTSMAAPIVSGSAAFILAHLPELDAERLIYSLQRGLSPLPHSSPNNLMQYPGILNLYNSLRILKN